MKEYLNLVQKILDNGVKKEDRTGTGALSIFGHQLRFDLAEGFPLVTTKKLFLKGIIHELLWFLSGSTNIQYLLDNNVHIWDDWADEQGELGPVYGHQWRSWPCASGEGIDQISHVIESIRNDPYSRRHLVSAWNVEYIRDMVLPPCHAFFQFNVANNRLSCQLYQRSADVFLGVPFNIASYSLLTHMVAQVVGLKPGEFIHTFGDAHLYLNHIDQAREQLTRQPFPKPTLSLNSEIESIFEFTFDDIRVNDYQSHRALKGAIAV